MIDANKLVKGDLVIGSKSSDFQQPERQYIFLELLPTSVKLRDRKKGWVITQSLNYFENTRAASGASTSRGIHTFDTFTMCM